MKHCKVLFTVSLLLTLAACGKDSGSNYENLNTDPKTQLLRAEDKMSASGMFFDKNKDSQTTLEHCSGNSKADCQDKINTLNTYVSNFHALNGPDESLAADDKARMNAMSDCLYKLKNDVSIDSNNGGYYCGGN